MNMKNTKAILLIVLGSFIIATGFAFAENVAYGQLEDANKTITLPVMSPPSQNITKEVAVTRAAAPITVVAPAVPAPTKVEEAKPAPSFLETAKKFFGDNKDQIVSAAAIGLLAFLIIGTGGAGLLVGLLAFGLFKYIM